MLIIMLFKYRGFKRRWGRLIKFRTTSKGLPIRRIQRTLENLVLKSIPGYEEDHIQCLFRYNNSRDGTVTFNKNTFKNTIKANSNVVNSFTDVLSTDGRQ